LKADVHRAVAAFFICALGAAACGELPDVTTLKDLRVLAVKCEPAGFLVDLENPGAPMPEATLTALVIDPTSGGEKIAVTAVGCPDYIDTITSATLQGTKLCPPESATSQIPDPIGMALRTTTIVPADMPQMDSPVPFSNNIEYQPAISFGLKPEQLREFFRSMPTGVPLLDQSIDYNRQFGLPAIVNLNFDLNGQHAEAIKRVVYWPRIEQLDPSVPPQEANKNPTLDGIRLYRGRDEATGNPTRQINLLAEPEPVVSISAGDKLYAEPYYPHAAETYYLRVNNVDTGAFETRFERELLRFQFYATAGKFDPPMQFSELNPALSGGTLHTDSEYVLPKLEDLPADGKVSIWIVTHDERAGSDWFKRTITVVP
jgi:hypothetical protein